MQKNIKQKHYQQQLTIDKSHKNLLNFPTIDRNVMQNIKIINVSHNNINSLQILILKSQTKFYNLLELDISYNKLNSTDSLIPLKITATNLKHLNIKGNPLEKILNYNFDISMTLNSLNKITSQQQILLNQTIRKKYIQWHYHGGQIINNFLQLMKNKSLGFQIRTKQSQMNEIKRILKILNEQNKNIYTKCQKIFSIIEQYNKFSQKQLIFSSKNQYMNNNKLYKYLNNQQQQQNFNLFYFYLYHMIQNKNIRSKILHEIEVEDNTLKNIQNGQINKQTQNLFIQFFIQKWNKQSSKYNSSHFTKIQSPFRSIQTYMSSNRKIQTQKMFFSFDLTWIQSTIEFIIHRMLSYLAFLQTDNNKISQYITFQQEIINQTYQQQNDSLDNQHIQCSPKSQNKYILQTSVKSLELIIKKIVFRLIKNAKFYKINDILQLCQKIQPFTFNTLKDSFRRIYQQNIYINIIMNKMTHFKLKTFFKAWLSVKKRKLKLLKKIGNRKTKQQKALLSVFLTQWRITTRNFKTQQRRKSRLKTIMDDDSNTILRRTKTHANIFRENKQQKSRKQLKNDFYRRL